MAEELDLDSNEGDTEEIISRKDSRIKSLLEKNKLTSEERDEKDRLLKEKEELLANTSKENEFLKGFTKVSTKYQGANDYQDKIWEKVKSGYDVEDATVSVLNKEGKFIPPEQIQERESPAGGSASTGITDKADKPINQRSKEELRAALIEQEQKGEFKL